MRFSGTCIHGLGRGAHAFFLPPLPLGRSIYTIFFALKGQCILAQGKAAVFFNTDAAALGKGAPKEPAAL